MILMQLKNISKSFGSDNILRNVDLEIKTSDRIAIVGRNGAGKSTLLKIMTNEISHDNGEIFKTKDLNIGYLEQHITINENTTVWQFMLNVFSDFIIEEKALNELAKKIEDNAHANVDDTDLIASYGSRLQKFEDSGGYRYESEIKGVLSGLKFTEDFYNVPVSSLSGGQKTRLALGELLLTKPELLFLDEPTNHLDIDTLTWLESYLLGYPGAIVIVSHDRYFLDKIVNTVYEVAHQTTTKYFGSYSKYLIQKSANYEQDLKRYDKQQHEIKEAEDFIQRNIARASTTKRAQSRRKALEQMQMLDKPLGDEAAANFSFQVNKASGNDVIQLNDFAFTYPNQDVPLFKNISFTAHRGERIALIGKNGIGKTTLLNEIMNHNPKINIGTNVEIGFYDQEQALLSLKNTVLEEVWSEFPHIEEKNIRSTLGNFLFTQDDVLKTVQTLSGGEKARVSLAKLMLLNANLLILDEPTNHLDLDSKEVLESALSQFPGTILFVSHDRYFINKIADKVIELTPDEAVVYLGDYDYYVDKKTEMKEIEAFENKPETVIKTESKRKLSFTEQKRVQSETRRLEREIAEIEASLEENEAKLEVLELQMTEPDVFQNHEKLMELTEETNELKEIINKLLETWETAQIDYEAYTNETID
ncbi:MAG TPA: ABC-F family ATP-binding cassette domain-containing protein [Pseudogracilibacillus sp.]|nr:ABC-F family ATP-binding cassette domain-containing protein [Pseudogracilibacillus sp.]